jgi:hypothetical protein
LFFFEVIVRQGHRAVENLQDSSGFVFLRRSTWTVALQARSVSVGTEKFVSLAAVWFVTGATALNKCGLVVDPLLCQIRDVRMTAQADFNGVRLRKSGILAGKGVVAIGAIADCPGMLHLCCVNLLGLSSWQVMQSDFATARVSTTFPSFAGAGKLRIVCLQREDA